MIRRNRYADGAGGGGWGGGKGVLAHVPPVFFALRRLSYGPPPPPLRPPHPQSVSNGSVLCRSMANTGCDWLLWSSSSRSRTVWAVSHVKDRVQIAERTCSSSSGLPRVKLRPFWVTDFAPRCQSKVQRFVCLYVSTRDELGQRETSVQKMY